MFLWDLKIEKKRKKNQKVPWGAFTHDKLLVKHMTLMIFITNLENLSSFDIVSADFVNG